MRFFLFIIFIGVSFLSFSHSYHFAFAEVEYNDFTQKIEATITISTHDFEIELSKKIMKEVSIEDKDLPNIQLESFILHSFKIYSNNVQCKLKLIGYEVLLNGVCNFYFESLPFALIDQLTFQFDLLMGSIKDQQNKLNFYFHNKLYSRPFTTSTKIHQILLDKT